MVENILQLKGHIAILSCMRADAEKAAEQKEIKNGADSKRSRV